MLFFTKYLAWFVNLLFFFTLSVSAQSTFSGRVTDKNGIALSGTNISIIGTNKVTVSDAEGKFTFEATAGTLIEFSHIGYTNRQVVLGAEMELTRNRVRDKVRIEFMREGPTVEAVSTDEKLLQKVKEAILNRLSDEQLSVDSLAEEIGLSRAHFYRKVTALTGLPVNELIRSFRLERAAQLLAQQWGPVSQVAFEVGFSNPSYFSKRFKDKFGVLPSEYTLKDQ